MNTRSPISSGSWQFVLSFEHCQQQNLLCPHCPLCRAISATHHPTLDQPLWHHLTHCCCIHELRSYTHPQSIFSDLQHNNDYPLSSHQFFFLPAVRRVPHFVTRLNVPVWANIRRSAPLTSQSHPIQAFRDGDMLDLPPAHSVLYVCDLHHYYVGEQGWWMKVELFWWDDWKGGMQPSNTRLWFRFGQFRMWTRYILSEHVQW